MAKRGLSIRVGARSSNVDSFFYVFADEVFDLIAIILSHSRV